MDLNNLIAIVVLNFNKKNDILDCLRSIFNLEYPEIEVIVVDNGSTDGSSEAIKSEYPDVHLVESKKNLGVAGGRNVGIKYADQNFNYKYLLFLDDDIVVDKKALTEMVCSFYKDKNIGIVAPKCLMSKTPGVIGYAGGMSVNLFSGKITNIGGGEKDEGQFDKPGFISSCGGLCLISRELINQVGIFDEKFNPYGWEDVDLSLRARQKGFKIFYNHKAVIYHKGGKKGRGKAINEYEYSKSKNYFYLIKKHSNLFQLLVLCCVLPARIITIAVKELFKGEFKTISAQVRGILSLLSNLFDFK
ncbi:MAG: glycosyltransferase family 2 protein [Ignavibacteria bacterium]